MAFDRAYFNEEQALVRQVGESELDYEKRKNEALFKLQVDHNERMLALAKSSGADEQTILGLEKTLAAAKKGLKDAQDQKKTGPQDIFDFLGIKFDKVDPKKNEEAKAAFNEMAQAAIEGTNQILSAQIAADQARIDSIDQMLDAKQNEISVEATLAAAGLANNLATKKQEYAALKAEREQALKDQRRNQEIQIALNAVMQASTMALALAKTIEGYAGYGPAAPFLIAGQAIAIIALFGSTLAQFKSLPKYHDGDEVTQETARRRSMADSPARSDEVDARLQIGEGVTRKKSYQSNKRLLQFINTIERPIAFDELQHYVRANPLGMPEQMRNDDLAQFNQYNEFKANGGAPDYELHSQLKFLNSRVDTLIEDNRRFSGTKTTVLPDGRLRIEDAQGNVTVKRY
jgi:hypothetical protein